MSDILKNSIIHIIKNHYDFFLNKSNVNGMGLGFKRINGVITNEPCLAVFVENKINYENLYKHEVIPKTFLGIKTDIVKSSTLKISNKIIKLPNTIPFSTNFKRPIQPGYSIGIDGISYGTLGAIVFDNDNNAPYILSNNHVLAKTNSKDIGTTIIQPGSNYILSNKEGFYNVITNNAVAYLYKKVILKTCKSEFEFNELDCAIAKIFPNVEYNTEIYEIGKVTGTTTAKIGDEIQKTGAKTEYTTGTINYTNSIEKVNFPNLGTIWFGNSIVCSRMSEKGDSGSLCLNSENKAVGLLFAGGEKETVLCPIDEVLKILNVHF